RSVKALKNELDATFKENITVYFDENPHDGLHETHDVDGSLASKTKCLVFVPIISRTYCDPDCFAWKHELMAFKSQAENDDFGMKIHLADGNVACRILPVQIHDLDEEDQGLFEKELCITLRPLVFVYASQGVNRPLGPVETHPERNRYDINYRDQVNKTANAIREIIRGIQNRDNKVSMKGMFQEIPGEKRLANGVSSASKKMIFGAGILLSMLVAVYFIFNMLMSSPVISERSIAVLPFDTPGSSTDDRYFADIMMEDVLIKLGMIGGFDRVIAKNSAEHYRDKNIPLSQVGKELNVAYIVTGTVMREGDQVRINVYLNEAPADEQIWAKTYTCSMSGLFATQTLMAREIAGVMETGLSQDESRQISAVPTENMEAYDYYIKGRQHYSGYTTEDYIRAIALYKKAIALDPGLLAAHAGLSDAYSQAARQRPFRDLWLDSAYMHANFVLQSNPYDSRGHKSMGLYYSIKGDTQRAIEEYAQAVNTDLNIEAVINLGRIYNNTGQLEMARLLFERVQHIHPMDYGLWYSLGDTWYRMGDQEKALAYLDKALEINDKHVNSLFLKWMLAALYRDQEEAQTIANVLGAIGQDATGEMLHFAYEVLSGDTLQLDIPAEKLLNTLKGRELNYFYIPYFNNLIAWIYVQGGIGDPAGAMLETKLNVNRDMISSGDLFYRHPYELAQVFATMGKDEEALHWLEQSFKQGFCEWKYFEKDPAFAVLRKTLHVKKLLEDYKKH
ncbi:MAG: tetratricopeptide repeat protein, partial [Cyclobacteriaceae bacterium]|nr:tetratricopeptide repeat protein [Cyclobacteriaceae bacterium]